MKHRKLFAILTLVCFMFTLMPVAAFATGEGTTPTVYIAGTEYTEALMETGTVTTPQGVSIDWASKTITLNGANIEWDLSNGIDEDATGVFSTAIGGVAVIWIDDKDNDWTMNIVGENTLKLSLDDFGENGRGFDVADGKALLCESGLTISGNGENAKLDISEKVFGYVSSIEVEGNLTIQDVVINIDNDFKEVGEYKADDFEGLSTTVLSSTGTLNIENADIDIDSEFFHGWGIYSGDETEIKDSDVNINGDKIQTGVGTAKGLTITGKETSVDIDCLSIGIGSTTTIKDAEVTITVDSTSPYDTKTGIYSASGEININSGTVAIESTGTGLGTFKGGIGVADGEITVEAPVAVSANKEASIEISTGSYTGSISTGTDSTVIISGENTTVIGDITMAGVSGEGKTATLTISGGNIGGTIDAGEGTTATVSGGTFSQPVKAEYLADGLNVQVKTEDGYTYFEDVEDAKEAAKDDTNAEIGIVTKGEGEGSESTTTPLTYTVSFNTNGGSAVTPQSIEWNKTAEVPTAPTKDGFTFEGWYSDEELTTKYEFDTTPVERDITLYAKWEENAVEHSHVFDQQVTTDAYKAIDATHTAKATYYYSCVCGEKGTETFEYGDVVAHVYETKYNETGHWSECVCGAKTETAAHVFGDWTVIKEATTSEAGEKERVCDCGYKETETIAKLTPSYTGSGSYVSSNTTDAEVSSPDADVKVTAKAISTSTLNDAKDAVADDENVAVIGGKDSAVQITAKEDGKAVDSFAQPVSVTVPVSKSALKDVEDVNKLTLALVTEGENGETVLTYVGGNYDAQEGTFTAYTDTPGNYVLVEKEDIKKIELTIGNAVAFVNGQPKVKDVPAQIINDRTLIPVRFVLENMNCGVDWNGDTRTVSITLPDDETLTMVIDEEIPGFGAAAIIQDDRTLVPVAYIAYAMDAYVLWVGDEQRVVIVK